MASGLKHEKFSKLLTVPFGFIIGAAMDWTSGCAAALAFLFGGIWLSPDLDTRSKALKRWGILQWIWWPYRKLIKHRSFLSHGPFIGTTLRILYLGLISYLLLLLFTETNRIEILDRIQTQVLLRPQIIIALLLGIEASVWLHLLLDGDPLPTQLKK